MLASAGDGKNMFSLSPIRFLVVVSFPSGLQQICFLDSVIMLWKLNELPAGAPNIFEKEDEVENKEQWSIHKILRLQFYFIAF